MADEKKAVNTSEASKGAKKEKSKEPGKLSPKRAGQAIKRFFKDLRGETKKIVWPGRHMVLKSTGIVLAAILIIGAGIWIIDYAISGGVTALSSAASKVEVTTEATTEAEDKTAEEHDHDEDDSKDESEEKSEESTTEA